MPLMGLLQDKIYCWGKNLWAWEISKENAKTEEQGEKMLKQNYLVILVQPQKVYHMYNGNNREGRERERSIRNICNMIKISNKYIIRCIWDESIFGKLWIRISQN